MSARTVRYRGGGEDGNQPAGIVDRQRPEQHRVEDAEQRDVQADADGERADRNR